MLAMPMRAFLQVAAKWRTTGPLCPPLVGFIRAHKERTRDLWNLLRNNRSYRHCCDCVRPI